ncbi:MAG: FtsB/FtsL family cell division protein [Planctomycetota bacterium]|jgi:cell division protein FtsB
MITESIILQELYVTSLSLTPTDKLRATGSFTSSSTVEGLFTVLAMIALITAIILLFWVFSKYKHAEHELNIKITGLSVNNVRLREEVKQLTTTNEKLQQENTELSREKIEALESRIETEAPTN